MKIITISREYGAGGRKIAKALAEKLGVEVYDKDIVRGAVRETGLDYDYIAQEGERVTKGESFIRKITPISYDQKDTLFEVQRNVILELASKGPCVMLGRCADAILQDAGIDCFNVFLHASEYVRGTNIGEYLNTTDAAQIQKEMHKTDSARRAHYERYTHRTWGNYKNYDLMLDSGMLGVDKCVELISLAIQENKEK